MFFSRHERQELDKIEQWFEASDPELAHALRDGTLPPNHRLRRWLRVGLDLLAGMLLVSGLLLGASGLILLGVGVLSAAVWLHVAHRPGEEPP
ncbi:DUF3040 domain-containing protein [Amycolatopsis anabasis]|uniref:DUF3040 domain-containing protein n=1 Tax=Amycolatopsis anabasis TaxID=1840409 RepID=UPI00131AE9FD|nr:DUF3040 domain-containing protein [Amycolatopsis anabasis]